MSIPASGFRTEKDSMGEMQVPAAALYAAQTQRAYENFPVSGERFSRPFIAALGLIKRCAAEVNCELGLLDKERAKAIITAAEEVIAGKLDEHFVLDIFQTGSGTSTNMNGNEVLANRAKQILDGKVSVHPNDHVNMCQSSNDVIPTAMHISAAVEWQKNLRPALANLQTALKAKANEFSSIVKTGRTHLQDATPITLGQEFSGYAAQVGNAIERTDRALASILELPLGGTAVGTGVNTHPKFSKRTIGLLAERTHLGFFEARNHFEAQAAKDGILEFSAQLRGIAVALAKIANDLRWLGSGPRCGLGELQLPEVQPGSSIMPAKVNPVIAESLLMVVAQVIGNDTAVTTAAHTGSTFELNVMMPVIAENVLRSVRLLANGATNFNQRCVAGLQPNRSRIHQLAEANIAVCTALAPKIGYDKAAQLAKEAYKSGATLREVALKQQVLPEPELNKILDLMSMTKPGLDE